MRVGIRSPSMTVPWRGQLRTRKIRCRFPAGYGLVKNVHLTAHGADDPENSVPGGIDAHMPQQYFRAGNQQGRGQKIGGGGNVSGDVDPSSPEPGFRLHGGCKAGTDNTSAKIAEH